MPIDDELPLILRAQQGDRRAQQELIDRHERQIKSIVDRYVGDFERERPDMEQEGRIGLLAAIRKFDPSHGTVFATFSEFYVRRYVIDHARTYGLTVRIPEDALDAYRNVIHQCHEWDAKGMTFTLSDAAKFCGHDPDTIYKVKAALSLEQLAIWVHDQVDNVDIAQEVERFIEKAELRLMIALALPKVTDHKERYTLKWYYGIDCKPRSLAQIAKHWGLDPSRVSQIHGKAKRTMAKILAADNDNHRDGK